MKRFLFILILLLGMSLSFFGYGQDAIKKDDFKTKSTEKIEKPNAIFFAPLNLFDFFQNPNFQIGYERFVAEKWSLQVEGGVSINQSIPEFLIKCVMSGFNIIAASGPPYLNNNKGFRVRGSVKYVVLEKRKFNLYASPEFFYSRHKSELDRYFSISDPDFDYSFEHSEWGGYWDTFHNDEEKIGVNFKAGIKLFLGNSFFIEQHLGIGFAHRNVIQTGRENPNDKLDDLLGVFDMAAPNKWVPTIPFNFKVGLRF